jgi:hypothetical protein
LIDHPTFADGKGLRVHIRTTRVKYFSYIEKVAVQIGDETLEFANDVDNFLLNGEVAPPNQLGHKTKLGDFFIKRYKRAISIHLDGYDGFGRIDLYARRTGFPAVIVNAGDSDVFKGALGLLGEYGTGKTLARDGVTEISIPDRMDASEFALEWQVRDTEKMLFKESRFPQHPFQCTPPEAMPASRLGARKEAEEACAHWEVDMEDCVFDVMATRDTLVAEEGHHHHVQME